MHINDNTSMPLTEILIDVSERTLHSPRDHAAFTAWLHLNQQDRYKDSFAAAAVQHPEHDCDKR